MHIILRLNCILLDKISFVLYHQPTSQFLALTSMIGTHGTKERFHVKEIPFLFVFVRKVEQV